MIIWHWYNSSTVANLATALHRYANVYGYGILINGLAAQATTYSMGKSHVTPRETFHVDSVR